jgi:hypothetical protein
MTRNLVVAIAFVMACCTTAFAAPVYWNFWTVNQNGFLPVGNQNLTVTYSSADFHNVILGFPSWNPASTWADGAIIGNGPAQFSNLMQIFGGTSTVNTLSFSQPVVDPVLAIFSLGSVVQGQASFVFTGFSPLNVVGGPSAEFGGNALTINGVTVSGIEGNGSIQFLGTYSSISWTNPQFEDYYGFNVGVVGVVPEPNALTLAVIALVGVTLRVSRSRCGGWLRLLRRPQPELKAATQFRRDLMHS